MPCTHAYTNTTETKDNYAQPNQDISQKKKSQVAAGFYKYNISITKTFTDWDTSPLGIVGKCVHYIITIYLHIGMLKTLQSFNIILTLYISPTQKYIHTHTHTRTHTHIVGGTFNNITQPDVRPNLKLLFEMKQTSLDQCVSQSRPV